MMYSVELFLEHWSNTIALLNGLASFLIAWLIFRAEQRISEDKTGHLFLSVLDEAGMQLNALQCFSESLTSAVKETGQLEEICRKKEDVPAFLAVVYAIKKKVCVTKFRPSLRKFHSYEGIFDEYGAKKIALWRRGKKVDVDVLRNYLKYFEDDMKECSRIQEEMSCLFPNFTVLFRGDASDIAKLVNMMDKYPTQEVFASKLSKSHYAFAPDWTKAEDVHKGIMQHAKNCAKICGHAEKMLLEFCRMYDASPSFLHAQISTARG